MLMLQFQFFFHCLVNRVTERLHNNGGKFARLIVQEQGGYKKIFQVTKSDRWLAALFFLIIKILRSSPKSRLKVCSDFPEVCKGVCH